MERLTKKAMLAGHEVNYVSSDDCFCVWSKPEKFMGEAIDRLASYEDIGLSPETVSDLLDRFNYFRRTIEGLDLVDHVHFGAFVDRVKRWAQAEKDGRLVEVVRCKDCKHLYFKDFSGFCPHRVSACSPDGFCEYGERRKPEEGTNAAT